MLNEETLPVSPKTAVVVANPRRGRPGGYLWQPWPSPLGAPPNLHARSRCHDPPDCCGLDRLHTYEVKRMFTVDERVVFC